MCEGWQLGAGLGVEGGVLRLWCRACCVVSCVVWVPCLVAAEQQVSQSSLVWDAQGGCHAVFAVWFKGLGVWTVLGLSMGLHVTTKHHTTVLGCTTQPVWCCWQKLKAVHICTLANPFTAVRQAPGSLMNTIQGAT